MKTKLTVLTLAVLCLTAIAALGGKAPVTAAPARQSDNCRIDLVMVLDSSGSITFQNYDVMRQFVIDLVNSFEMGPDDAYISIIQFSDTVNQEIGLSGDQATVVEEVRTMTKLNNNTNITAGLELAERTLVYGGRPETPRVIIVLTDGLHNTGPVPIPVADRIRADESNEAETVILGVAVGDFALGEIIGIAGGDFNVIQVPDFNGLQLIRSILYDYSCAVVTGQRPSSLPTRSATLAAQPTPIPPPQGTPVVIQPPATPVQGQPTPNVQPTIVAMNPLGDSTRLVFASERDGDSDIFVMEGDGSDVQQVTFNEANDDKPSWSPDGRRIAFESNLDGDYDIYVMDDDGGALTKLTDNNVDDWGPAWSPDGSQIAYHSAADGDIEIYVMNADGSGTRQLTQNNIATDRSPEWSPDGTRLAYFSDVSGGREIYLLEVATGAITRITDDEWYDGFPKWSPDGTRLTFSSTRTSANAEIFTMALDGTDKRRLTDYAGTDEDPAYSPDGAMIVFESTLSGNWDLWIVNVDGTGLQQLTNSPARDWSADWAVKP